MRLIAVTLLPEPLSPTIATLSPSRISKLIPFTASVRPAPRVEADFQVFDFKQAHFSPPPAAILRRMESTFLPPSRLYDTSSICFFTRKIPSPPTGRDSASAERSGEGACVSGSNARAESDSSAKISPPRADREISIFCFGSSPAAVCSTVGEDLLQAQVQRERGRRIRTGIRTEGLGVERDLFEGIERCWIGFAHVT